MMNGLGGMSKPADIVLQLSTPCFGQLLGILPSIVCSSSPFHTRTVCLVGSWPPTPVLPGWTHGTLAFVYEFCLLAFALWPWSWLGPTFRGKEGPERSANGAMVQWPSRSISSAPPILSSHVGVPSSPGEGTTYRSVGRSGGRHAGPWRRDGQDGREGGQPALPGRRGRHDRLPTTSPPICFRPRSWIYVIVLQHKIYNGIPYGFGINGRGSRSQVF